MVLYPAPPPNFGNTVTPTLPTTLEFVALCESFQEYDQLRMNAQEMSKAADATQGQFYTLATADQVVDDVPSGGRVSIPTGRPPFLVWNHTIVFLLVMLLLTSEWLLRKRKHLL